MRQYTYGYNNSQIQSLLKHGKAHIKSSRGQQSNTCAKNEVEKVFISSLIFCQRIEWEHIS